MEEGYIKFGCFWEPSPAPSLLSIQDLINCRQALFKLEWIGEYPNGIGYGNLSKRLNDNTFIISGNATGGIPIAGPEHFTTVEQYSIEKNSVSCRGPIKASSESLTHAALYESSSEIKAVIHIHNKKMWKKLQNIMPSTPKGAEFGSCQLAEAIKELTQNPIVLSHKIIVMKGHEDGILSFGNDLKQALDALLQYK